MNVFDNWSLIKKNNHTHATCCLTGLRWIISTEENPLRLASLFPFVRRFDRLSVKYLNAWWMNGGDIHADEKDIEKETRLRCRRKSMQRKFYLCDASCVLLCPAPLNATYRRCLLRRFVRSGWRRRWRRRGGEEGKGEMEKEKEEFAICPSSLNRPRRLISVNIWRQQRGQIARRRFHDDSPSAQVVVLLCLSVYRSINYVPLSVFCFSASYSVLSFCFFCLLFFSV